MLGIIINNNDSSSALIFMLYNYAAATSYGMNNFYYRIKAIEVRRMIFWIFVVFVASWIFLSATAFISAYNKCADSDLITYSPDGQSIACKIWKGYKKIVVIDEEEGKQYDWTGFPMFSPDSQIAAYKAKLGSGWFVVYADRDGKQKEGKYYDEIISVIFYPKTHQYLGFFIFSPASSLVYGARDNRGKFVVHDSIEGKPYDEVRFLIFSPDGKEFAYKAKLGDRWFVVLNHEEGRAYEEIVSIATHPDSRRLGFVVFVDSGLPTYKARIGEEWFLVSGSKEEVLPPEKEQSTNRPDADSLDTTEFEDLSGEDNVQNLFERMARRFQDVHNNWLKITGSRIESRLDKLAEEMGEDSPSLRLQLAEARLSIGESERYLNEARLKFEGVPESDNPKAAFGEVRKLIEYSFDEIEQAHKIFIDIVGEIKEAESKI